VLATCPAHTVNITTLTCLTELFMVVLSCVCDFKIPDDDDDDDLIVEIYYI
jgi:hypothetical protein